ncbi:hypothetical protein AWV63_12500 [Micromonospora rifamycinica]|nr:hypothetical protein AWV63_12500 [Micromonospora rifamycinica]
MRTGLRRVVALGAAGIVFGSPWPAGIVSAPPPPAGRVTPPPSARAPVFRWPLDGPPRPVRRFDPPPRPWLAGHRGVDLAAASGATVRSAGAGTVLFAGMVAGRPVVTVGHPGGLRTTYEPVRPVARPGDVVVAGAPLGALLTGHPGCPPLGTPVPTGSCLHWGVRRGPDYLDPLALLGLGPVRLLPVGWPVSPDQPSVSPGRPRPALAGLRPASGQPWLAFGRTRSALSQQRRQSGGQPFVLVGGVVYLAAEP